MARWHLCYYRRKCECLLNLIWRPARTTCDLGLHYKLDAHQLNLVNKRKEFFNVSLDDVAKHVEACRFDIELTKYAEAQQYRESLVLREQQHNREEIQDQVLEEFSAAI